MCTTTSRRRRATPPARRRRVRAFWGAPLGAGGRLGEPRCDRVEALGAHELALAARYALQERTDQRRERVRLERFRQVVEAAQLEPVRDVPLRGLRTDEDDRNSGRFRLVAQRFGNLPPRK